MDNWRFRRGFNNTLVLQREVKLMVPVGPMLDPAFVWRDAVTEDLGDYYRELISSKGEQRSG